MRAPLLGGPPGVTGWRAKSPFGEQRRYLALLQALVQRHNPHDRIKRSQPQVLVIWNRYSLVTGDIRLYSDVASPFMRDPVVEPPHQDINDLSAAEVPGSLMTT
jgi:hypothetical protein